MDNGETSQNTMTNETFDGSLNFDEADFEESAQENAEANSEPENQEEAAEDQAVFLKVRFNKADKTLTKAEAVELAQKGMNYDHIKAELDSYRDGPIGKALKVYADQAGVSVEKYAEMMAAQADAAAEKKAMDELREKWPDAPDELLKEHVRLQRGENQAKAASAEEAKRQQEWAEAMAEYPDVKPDAIPQDVHDAIAQGASPLEALHRHELNELRKKVADFKSEKEKKQKQEDNRARSIGSLASMAKSQEDDFLSEFA